jgi:hypothetical protein
MTCQKYHRNILPTKRASLQLKLAVRTRVLLFLHVAKVK